MGPVGGTVLDGRGCLRIAVYEKIVKRERGREGRGKAVVLS